MNPHHVTPTTSGFRASFYWGASLTGAIATSLWFGAPAQGDVLNDWQFDPQTQQLTVILPDGVTPSYFLLAEPARIVLNLPSTQLGPVLPVQYYQGPIESIRVSQFDAESARVVVEFAPNTVLDPRHAELSSNDLAGGTLWTLRPLVEDSPAGTTVTLDPARALPSPTLTTPAAAAVTGAVGPPSYTANDGIRTDASPLIDGGVTAVTDQPPSTLPLDPFSAGTEPQVSVPPLADSAIPATPAVSVPPLADLPQVLPPEAVVVPEPQVLAQSPATPVAPAAPTAVAPPAVPAETVPVETAPAETAPVPLVVVPAPVAAVIPSGPVASPQVPTPGSAPVEPQNPVVSPVESAVPTEPPAAPAAPIAPPFLTGTAAANAVSAVPTERRTIPPPPVAPQSDGTIPFGTPLPDQAKSDPAAIAVAPQQRSILPVGTLLSLQYPGATPLVLDRTEPWNEVLIVVDDVVDAQTGQVLLAAGTQVLGRFEGFDQSGRRFVTQSVVTPSGDNPPLLAESEWLLGTRVANGGNLVTNSGLGAAAVTILSGFSGIGLLGGAALGAATTYATGSQLVTIQPGQIIVVEVVDEILPFQ